MSHQSVFDSAESHSREQRELRNLLSSADIPAALAESGRITWHSSAWQRFFADNPDGVPRGIEGFLNAVSAVDTDRVSAALSLVRTTHRIDLEEGFIHLSRRRGYIVTLHPVGESADAVMVVITPAGASPADQGASRYRYIFENAYVSLWEEDIRSLRHAAALAKKRGVTDIRSFLRENPGIAREAARNVRVLDVNAATVQLYGAKSKEELLGSLDQIFIDDTLPLFIEEIAAVFEGRKRLEEEIRVRTLTGEDRYVIISFAIPSESDQFDHVLVSMLDITERRREQQEREALLRLEHERHLLARTLSHITLSLTSLRQVDEVLDEILTVACTLVPFESGNIALLQDGTVQSVRWIGYRETGGEELIRTGRPKIEDLPVEQRVMETQRPLVVENTETDPRWRRFPGTEWICSFLIVPIVFQNEVRGFLRLDSKERGHFRVEDGEKLLPLANAAAVALENARLVEQMEEEITERRNAENRLRRSLEEKDILVQEIHHRVKNNLAMVASIISLQRNELPAGDQVSEAFDELQSRIRAIAAVHEQLHQTGSISQVHLPEYVADVARGISSAILQSDGRITLTVECDELMVTASEAAPIGLMINEAVTNAVKHAFPEGRRGSIVVRVRGISEAGKPRRVSITVEDDGVGLPPEAEPEKSDSLGAVLLRSLASQFGGEMTFHATEGAEGASGTTITISVPARPLVSNEPE
ncbi:MAG: sensor histidine kinase [Spirochaetaceae bacterium]